MISIPFMVEVSRSGFRKRQVRPVADDSERQRKAQHPPSAIPPFSGLLVIMARENNVHLQ